MDAIFIGLFGGFLGSILIEIIKMVIKYFEYKPKVLVSSSILKFEGGNKSKYEIINPIHAENLTKKGILNEKTFFYIQNDSKERTIQIKEVKLKIERLKNGKCKIILSRKHLKQDFLSCKSNDAYMVDISKNYIKTLDKIINKQTHTDDINEQFKRYRLSIEIKISIDSLVFQSKEERTVRKYFRPLILSANTKNISYSGKPCKVVFVEDSL